MSPFHERARHVLPRLTANNYRETSPATWTYDPKRGQRAFALRWSFNVRCPECQEVSTIMA
jgi:hypothetical protein